MQPKTQVYLLSAALVGSLGLNAAQTGAIGSAHASEARTKPVEGRAVYSITQAKAATGAQMAAAACAAIDADEGLSGEDVCRIADLCSLELHFCDDAHPGEAVLVGRAKLQGTWTRAVPQE